MINAEEVKGFDKLSIDNACLFRSFINNFYNVQGSESKATFKPTLVRATADKENGRYLRFEYQMNNKKCWLHVTGPHTWY